MTTSIGRVRISVAPLQKMEHYCACVVFRIRAGVFASMKIRAKRNINAAKATLDTAQRGCGRQLQLPLNSEYYPLAIYCAHFCSRCRVRRVVAAASIHANSRFIGNVSAVLHVEMRGTLGLLLLAIASSVSAQSAGEDLLSTGKLHFFM